jgi:protein dithiol oxidoreductase (disulfide-forming)
MKRYLPFALLAALALTACTGKDDAAAGTDAPAATDSAAVDAQTLKDAEIAAAAGNDPNAVVADPAAADAGATPAAAPAAADGPVPGLKLGTDYQLVQNGQPFEPLNGKIEVVEMFNFVCPACASFQPLIGSWKKTLPADVRFTYVPAAFGGNWDQYVRAFYASQTMGIADKAHEKVYDAIHLEGKLKGERGEDSDADISAFYAQFGVDAKAFAGNMKSFAVTGKFNKAKQYFASQSIGATPSTPTIFINGKYRVLGRSAEDRLRVADALIAYERAQASGAAAAPATP